MDIKSRLEQGIDSLKITLTKSSQMKLLQYITLLERWNRAYNLISDADPDIILKEHILDSLTIAPYVTGQKILDVGSGAGFPGIPLAINFPGKQFVLLDSVGKKTRFLEQVAVTLKLNNIEVVQARVEEYQTINCFDQITMRAFSNIDDIISKTQHLCCAEGSWLIMKGQYPEEELKNFAHIAAVHELKNPLLKKARHLVIIEKAKL